MTCFANDCNGKLKYQYTGEDGDYYFCTKCGYLWRIDGKRIVSTMIVTVVPTKEQKCS